MSCVEAAGMTPLWRAREGLMPPHPQPRAVPYLWRWAELDLFTFCDAAVVEKLSLLRTEVSG